MSKKYLVTGGSGFIGAALVKKLVKKGNQVRVLDNNSRGNLRRLTDVLDDIEFIQGDIRDPETVNKAVQGQEAVCHLAYVNGTKFFYTKPELVLDVGVKGMVNILDACIQNGIKEFILASSSEVYQMPPSIPTDEAVPLIVPDVMNPRYSYGAGKIISEVMAANYGRKHFERVIIFRPHNVYGADMGWEHVIPEFCLRMKDTKDGTFPIQGSGLEKRSFIYIEDFIQGLMQVITKGNHLEIYHIGTQEEVTMIEVANKVAMALGKTIEVIPGELQPGSALRRCPDISKIETLGFDQKWTLAAGIKETAQWYIENDHLAS